MTSAQVGELVDRGACAGRSYLERGEIVVVLTGWRGRGPRNVLIRRASGEHVVRPFRGLRRAARVVDDATHERAVRASVETSKVIGEALTPLQR